MIVTENCFLIIILINNNYILRQTRTETKLILQKQKLIKFVKTIEKNIDMQNKDKTIKKISREEIIKN